jgi:diguanylate cyclase (GGDEF)-like protein
MATDPLDIIAVALRDEELAALDADSFTVHRAADLSGADGRACDAIVLSLDGSAPIDAIQQARGLAPDAAIVVLTDPANAADGSIAVHAGAEDHLVRDATLPTLLPRAIRYACGLRRIRRELATVDEATGLPNLRGFSAIGAHYLRMADRLGQAAVFVFVRLEDHADVARQHGPEAGDVLATDAAEVILQAVRDSDVPARIAPDTICVLLTGEAEGAESLVLSRLVEAIATHDARRPEPRALSLGVGTARYEPGSGAQLGEILADAVQGLSARKSN